MAPNKKSKPKEQTSVPVDGNDLNIALVAAINAVLPRLHRTMRQAVVRAEGENRLTMPQLRCLQAVAAEPGAALTSQLARQLQVTAPTVTNMIDGLVERGLVERQPDPDNRRQVLLTLTTAGRDVMRRYEAVMAGRLRDLIGHLDQDQKSCLLLAMKDAAFMLDADEAEED
jgi:DNA-binding MarR family transcriptional regulator